MPAIKIQKRCPCGSGQPYPDCCGALHAGRRVGEPTARTAERLMRSRYSAFAVGDADYVLATWHRSTIPASLDLTDDVEWRRLEVRRTAAGGEHDDHGTVEFVASFWDPADQRHGQVHETSTFVRQRGQWFYVGPVPE